MTSLKTAFGLLLALAASAGTARAEEPAVSRPRSGVEEHDGFYLRLLGGPGYTNMSTSGGSLSGGGFGFSLALGGVISPNIIVYGELVESLASSPTLSAGGSDSKIDATAGIAGFGPGIASYFSNNVYASGTLLLARLTAADNNSRKTSSTDAGIGGSFVLGKEWWVSNNWGLGVAAQVCFARVSDGGVDWTAYGTNLLFSATFN